MAEILKSKRVFFPDGKQRKFLLQAQKILDLSWIELARMLKISNRTLTDWKREKFSISSKAVKILTKKTGLKLPKNIEMRGPYWYASKGAKIGGLAVYRKYGKIGGDEEYREKRWHEWWNKKGKFMTNNLIFIRKPIRKPKKDINLAEFVGIMIGDGGISKRQIRITLNPKTDYEYSLYVINLIKKLFDVVPSVYKDKKFSAIDITISRTNLVEYCKSIGLKIGDKIRQGVDIPSWIKVDKKLTLACLRGIMDTDGCVIKHCYKVNNKRYCYKKLAFSNRSQPLLKSIHKFTKTLGFSSRFTSDKKDVRLDSVKDVKNYFKIIGTNNPKHKTRFKSCMCIGGVA